MAKANPLTEEQIAEALRIRKLGKFGRLDWKKVAKAMPNMSEHRLRAHFEPRFLEVKRASRNRSQEQILVGYNTPTRGPRPSDIAIAERDRRLNLRPASLTAAVFGDPLPGMSALDRRNG